MNHIPTNLAEEDLHYIATAWVHPQVLADRYNLPVETIRYIREHYYEED